MNAIVTTPGSAFDSEAFFDRVQSASARVLMLDYDGTLAPFHRDPAQAVPYPGVLPLLNAIMEAGHTRVVVISGRWIKDLLPLLTLTYLPEMWGSHGWERCDASGDYQPRRIGSTALGLLVTADDWAIELEAIGARAERKPASIAFHWRGCTNSQIAEIRSKLLEKWVTLSRFDELTWHDFDGGIELRVHGCNKGDVVQMLVAEMGPDAAYSYLGDDLTDEDAFKAIPVHGASILVRSQFRPTSAALWMRGPDELLDFLTRWHEKAGKPR